jgi:hypothetical protein
VALFDESNFSAPFSKPEYMLHELFLNRLILETIPFWQFTWIDPFNTRVNLTVDASKG